MVAADGRTVWFHDEAHLIRDVDGDPARRGRASWSTSPSGRRPRSELQPARRNASRRSSSTCRRSSTGVAGRRPREVLPQPAGGADLRVHRRGMDLDARLLGRPAPPRRSRTRSSPRTASPRRTHRPYSLEYRFRRADGTYVWVHDEAVCSSSRTRASDGFWQGFLFDVTARKEAEEQLSSRASCSARRSSTSRRSSIARRPTPTVERRSTSSPQVETMFGYTARGVVASDARVLDGAHPPRRRASVVARGEPARQRDEGAVLARSTGSGTPTAPTAGSTTRRPSSPTSAARRGGRASCIDITERKEAEQQLREAEEMFRTIVEQQPGGDLPAGVRPRRPRASRAPRTSRRSRPSCSATRPRRSSPTRRCGPATVHPDDRDRVLVADVDEQPRRRTDQLLARVPDDQQGRADRLGPGHALAGARSRDARPSGRGS